MRLVERQDIERWSDQFDAKGKFPVLVSRLIRATAPAEYWREWSMGPMGQLPPESVIAGRVLEIKLLNNFLNGNPGIKVVKAASKEEATAFILAAAKSFDEHPRERFTARTLIIDSVGNFRSVRMNARSLNLIARFDEPQSLYLAAADGHHVLVPQGPDDTLNQETIELPTIDRDGQIKALCEMGLSSLDAERFSRESGRDITVLKRLLRFPQNKLPWLTEGYISKIIPAMMVG